MAACLLFMEAVVSFALAVLKKAVPVFSESGANFGGEVTIDEGNDAINGCNTDIDVCSRQEASGGGGEGGRGGSGGEGESEGEGEAAGAEEEEEVSACLLLLAHVLCGVRCSVLRQRVMWCF